MTDQKTPHSQVYSLHLKRVLQCLTLSTCLALTLGCSAVGKPNTFIFVPDLPPNFKYELKAIYLPLEGETCRVAGKPDFWVSFNKPNMEYVSTAEIELYKTASDCPLVLNHVEIKIIGVFGPERSDSSYDYASFAVRPELLERQMGTFRDDETAEFFGECMWSFRTVGPKRYLIKLLTCKKMDAQGNVGRSRPSTAYTLTQLAGITVRLKIKLS
ncbi:hypothetical protein A1354_29210, partial [Pseudomonas asplenii]